jgi:murein DD-endopeptidase MepM/ murein hydrolase activator NlpD
LLNRKNKNTGSKGFFKNPLFYFGLFSVVLLGLLCFSPTSLAKLGETNNSNVVFFNTFFKDNTTQQNADLFFNQNEAVAMETPDLKIIQDSFIYGISTPRVLTTKTLGDVMGGSSQNKDRKDVIDYTVQPGDTIESIAQNFSISTNTILWANNISKGTALKSGQSLVILPVSGVLDVVKSGDTVSDLARKYKSKAEDIIAFNNLANEGDIFIGDILIIPGGIVPQNTIPSINVQAPLADSFFIYPAEGVITQGLHYFNAVDLANKCGTPIYAAAAGTVQRAVFNGSWNFGMGNYITILHTDGISSYYGHLMSLFVKPGDKVNVGDRIGLMGKTGDATGCHVHFQVMGGKNPLAKYSLNAVLKYK